MGSILIFFSLISGGLGIYILNSNVSFFMEWLVITLNSVEVEICLYLDSVAAIFISLVILISGLIIIYSDQYIAGEKFVNRFLSIVLLFVISIIFLIISPNLIRILLGWDGLGLVSYCLVIFYQSSKSFNAGMITALSNRIGDVIILLAITYIFNLGTWNFSLIINTEHIRGWDTHMVGLLLIVAAITKRAQIPFSAWLPAAIAAPTPVSSLVHSSTLVTAGVYLLIRFNFLLIYTGLRRFLFFIAIITTLIAGVGANYETDLKKIIALSTLSQLGLIIRILSLGYPILAFFHLLTHAIFKALLFICAGNFIHRLKNNQDIRWMGGLRTHIPVTASCFLVANMALCGLPFLAGFYSKDLILERGIQYSLNFWGITIYYFSTGLTVRYTARVVRAALGGEFKGSPYTNWGDENWIITIPIIILTVLAVLGGVFLRWILIEPQTVIIPLYLKWWIYTVITLGGLVGGLISRINFLDPKLKLYNITYFYRRIIFLPTISSNGIISKPLSLGSSFSKNLDLGWRESFGPQGLSYFLRSIRKGYESWQTFAFRTIVFLVRIIFISLLF